MARTPNVRFRLAQSGDRGALRAFLDRLSPSTINARYLTPASTLVGELGDRELERIVARDGARHVVIVAVDGPEIRGVGEFLAEDREQAELALVVEDAFQERGIGRSLLTVLEEVAQERGIRAFTGDVGYGNSRVQSLLRATGHTLHTRPEYGSLRFSLVLGTAAQAA